MAEKVKFIIDIDDNGSSKVIDGFNDKLKDTKKATENAEKGVENTIKSAKSGEGIFNNLGKAIKGAFAMTGVMKILDLFMNLLMENEKVAELFRKGMVVLQGVFNGLMEVIDPLFPLLEKIFSNPLESLKEFGTLIKENIINRFEGLLELIPNLGKAISLLFKGEFTEAGKVAANAFGKVALGVEDTVGMVQSAVNFVGKAVETIAKSTKKAFDNKDVLANAEKNIERLSILYQGIVEKYDLMAEKQRQIRDDESKTISERIKANEELAKVLDEGAKKEKENINARIGILQTQNKLLGNNKDRQNEILSLTQELTAVDAKYAGLKSEQLTNINSLERESIELKRSEAEGTIEANKIIAQANIDRMADDLEKFDARKKLLDEEYNEKIKLANDEIAKYAEGTQAHIDAVNQKKILDAQYSVDSMALMDERIKYMGEVAESELENERNLIEQKKEIQKESIESLKNLMNLSNAFLENSSRAIDEDYTNRIAKLKELGYSEEEISNMRDSELEKINDRARQNFEIAKKLNYAQTLMSTIQGTQEAFTTANKSPITPFFPAYPFLQAAAAAAFGVAQLQQISQSQFESKLNPSAGSGGGGSQAMPSVGIVSGQMNQTNQLQAQLNSQMSKPTRAYVVGQNVTSQQSLDRHIMENATL
jgi:hypothetical protein